MSYYCTGCWARDNALMDPPLHEHAKGCFERHRVFGERLAPDLVARGPHECAHPDTCKDGGVPRYSLPRE